VSGDDWLGFPPDEQRAFAFARKLTRSPGAVTTADIRGIRRDFGDDRSVSGLMDASRCNDLVRVSKGFQLSLERDDLFLDSNSDAPARAKPTAEPAGR
jgi:hypothetical protein